MQETIKIGDALLAEDINYVMPEQGRIIYSGKLSKYKKDKNAILYIAYPSATIPRFLIPQNDRYAMRFALNAISVGHGLRGVLLRFLLKTPGGSFAARTFLFRECIVIAI